MATGTRRLVVQVVENGTVEEHVTRKEAQFESSKAAKKSC